MGSEEGEKRTKMDTFLRDRTAKVLVVDTSGASRTLLTEVIRGQGFADVNGVQNLKDALGVLEVEPVGWLVCPMFADQPENLMQVLDLMCNHPELRQLRVTGLVEETEQDLLPLAFEKGLLSYHRKPFTKDSLTNDLKDLFVRYENCAWKSSSLAGSYLRQHLIQGGHFQDLLTLEKQLLKLMPGDLQQHLNLVPPLAKTGKIEEAKAILSQIKKLEPSLESQVQTLATTYLETVDLQSVETPSLNILGLKTVIAIDSDTAVQNEVKAALQELGVENIQIFEDGEAALEYIKANHNPDLVLQEWRIPKLTGPLFLQKAQEEGARSSPFVLHTSLIQKEEIPFVREMGVAHIINKPLQRKEFIQGIIWTIQQDRQPTEQGSMERKMRQLLADRNFEEAKKIKERFVGDGSISMGAKEVIEAEFAYAFGDYEKARDFGIEGIKHAGESIFILNLLGKTMIALREFETALKCFQKAQSLAPMNLERLCQIAEIHSDLGAHDKARELLEQVKDMDPDSERAQEAAAKVAINSGDISMARKIMSQLRAMENVVSYMNNQAVAMARCGMANESIEQYRKTLEAVPVERSDIKGTVYFNLALGHLRANQLPDAKQALGECIACKESKVLKRAEVLVKKVATAIEKGLQIHLAKTETTGAKLHEATPSNSTGEDKSSVEEAKEIAKSKVLAIVQNQAGDIACYMIYKTSLDSSRGRKMLEQLLRFNPRKAIARQESMGADRVLASTA
jgi:CheY-like chemotaxis protein